MPKHEAQQKLADYISEYTGRLTKQGDSITLVSCKMSLNRGLDSRRGHPGNNVCSDRARFS